MFGSYFTNSVFYSLFSSGLVFFFFIIITSLYFPSKIHCAFVVNVLLSLFFFLCISIFEFFFSLFFFYIWGSFISVCIILIFNWYSLICLPSVREVRDLCFNFRTLSSSLQHFHDICVLIGKIQWWFYITSFIWFFTYVLAYYKKLIIFLGLCE